MGPAEELCDEVGGGSWPCATRLCHWMSSSPLPLALVEPVGPIPPCGGISQRRRRACRAIRHRTAGGSLKTALSSLGCRATNATEIPKGASRAIPPTLSLRILIVMSQVTVDVEIAASPNRVWEELADVASHEQWMTDAESIEFTSEQRSGVGTAIEVVTRVGPLRTVDRMRFTGWDEGRSMTVVHEGLVSGTGTFTIEPHGSASIVRWEEDLAFPLVVGGGVGATVARPICRRIWSANLRRLAARVDGA